MQSLSALWEQLSPYLESELSRSVLRALVILVVGLPLARVLASLGARLARRAVGAPRAQVLRGFAWYALLFVVILSALRELGFDLSVLLGAAGVLTVALGFASQTSASNIISGLFLLGERPFEPGDSVEVEGVSGQVLSIDLLSVKLRTFDNRFVRVPNETLVKARIVNLTRFPIRRIDLLVGVAYASDLDHVEEVLRRVASEQPLVLEEPRALFNVEALGDSAVQLKFGAWADRDSFVDARVALHKAVLDAFRQEGIEIPFPQRVVTTTPALSPSSSD